MRLLTQTEKLGSVRTLTGRSGPLPTESRRTSDHPPWFWTCPGDEVRTTRELREILAKKCRRVHMGARENEPNSFSQKTFRRMMASAQSAAQYVRPR
jgi:hypothetical protein